MELCPDINFDAKNTDTQQAMAGDKENDPFSASATFGNLFPKTKYYYRVCLETPDGRFPGVEAGKFVSGSFTTLIDSDEQRGVSFMPGSVGNMGAGNGFKAIDGKVSEKVIEVSERGERALTTTKLTLFHSIHLTRLPSIGLVLAVAGESGAAQCCVQYWRKCWEQQGAAERA